MSSITDAALRLRSTGVIGKLRDHGQGLVRAEALATELVLDLYEPTRDTIDAIRPYLTKGSVLAFDELAHAKWPGETAALRDILGTDHGTLRTLPGRATPAYLRWGT